jgi:hypothetical protein
MLLIYAIGIALVAQLFIYFGLVFMAGKLLPNLLTPVYHLIPDSNFRLLFSSVTVMLIGNYFFQRLYSLQPVLIAGIISTVTGVFIVNVGGLIIERKAPSVLLTVGVTVLVTGAIVCVYARSRLWGPRLGFGLLGSGRTSKRLFPLDNLVTRGEVATGSPRQSFGRRPGVIGRVQNHRFWGTITTLPHEIGAFPLEVG